MSRPGRRSVRTAKIGNAALWVWSGLVNDAKTAEHWHEEMRAAVQRMSAIDDGQPFEPVRRRRHWTDITTPSSQHAERSDSVFA